jgi:hypothetical protein
VAPIEENASVLMEAEQQRIVELNVHNKAEATAHEAWRLALNEEFRRRHSATRGRVRIGICTP